MDRSESNSLDQSYAKLDGWDIFTVVLYFVLVTAIGICVSIQPHIERNTG